MLRYKQDIGPVFLVIALAVTQLSVFFLVDNIYVLLAIAAFLVIPQGSATAVNHNHQHLSIFHSTPLNRMLEVILFFNTGCGPNAWVLHHTLGHHMNYLDQSEDTCGWKRKDGSTMHWLEYTLLNTLKIYPEIWRVGQHHPSIFKRFKFWLAVCLAILAVFIYIDPIKSIILFIIPMVIQLILLVFATVNHHRGLDTQNKYAATRNDVTKLNNLYAWNLGYHTAHHVKCGLHWSKLPELHAEIEGNIPENLIRRI